MKKLSVLLFVLLIVFSLSGQTKIPEIFWQLPFYRMNNIIDLLQAGGLNQKTFKDDPNPDLLYKKIKYQNYQQLDGTFVRTTLGKQYLKGNIVNIELLTYNGKELIVTAEIAIYCDVKKKQNFIYSLTIKNKNGIQNILSISRYDFNDEYVVGEISALYGAFFYLFPIWYDKEDLGKYLD